MQVEEAVGRGEVPSLATYIWQNTAGVIQCQLKQAGKDFMLLGTAMALYSSMCFAPQLSHEFTRETSPASVTCSQAVIGQKSSRSCHRPQNTLQEGQRTNRVSHVSSDDRECVVLRKAERPSSPMEQHQFTLGQV